MYQILATTMAGLEQVLAEELEQLGIKEPQVGKRAVTFSCDKEELYKVNLWSRLALRFYKHIDQFEIEKAQDIYDGVNRTKWWKIIGVDQSFRFDNNVSSSLFQNPLYATHLAKDAIVDQFRSRFNHRPNVQKNNPDFTILIALKNNLCTLWMDSSGEALFKRGYRIKAAEAPINEVLAAGLIALSGWDKKQPLLDPMCGSGTIPVEAALMGMNIPPSSFREKFAFMTWSDFSGLTWKKVKEESLDLQSDNELTIMGSDINKINIDIARFNIQKCRLHKDIILKQADFLDLEKPFDNGFIVTNPPYGERLKHDEITKLYKGIGDQLKSNYSGYRAWLFSSNPLALKSIGLRPSKRIPLYNGPLECRLLGFDLFKGSWDDQK